MKRNCVQPNDKPTDGVIIIADECGDSLWEAVLNQEQPGPDMSPVRQTDKLST